MLLKNYLLLKCVIFSLLLIAGCNKNDVSKNNEVDEGSGSTGKATLALHSYYVAPNGSDSNPGTLALPFFTMTKAQSVAVAGDDIFFRGGTYVFQNAHIARTETTYARIFYLNKSGTSSAGSGI